MIGANVTKLPAAPTEIAGKGVQSTGQDSSSSSSEGQAGFGEALEYAGQSKGDVVARREAPNDKKTGDVVEQPQENGKFRPWNLASQAFSVAESDGLETFAGKGEQPDHEIDEELAALDPVHSLQNIALQQLTEAAHDPLAPVTEVQGLLNASEAAAEILNDVGLSGVALKPAVSETDLTNSAKLSGQQSVASVTAADMANEAAASADPIAQAPEAGVDVDISKQLETAAKSDLKTQADKAAQADKDLKAPQAAGQADVRGKGPVGLTAPPQMAAVSAEVADVSIRVLRRETHAMQPTNAVSVDGGAENPDPGKAGAVNGTQVSAQNSASTVMRMTLDTNASNQDDLGQLVDVVGEPEFELPNQLANAVTTKGVTEPLTQRLTSTILSEAAAMPLRTESTAQTDASGQASGVLKVIELELQPLSLGKITLRLSLQDSALGVQVAAQKSETVGLMKLEHDKLQQALQNVGLNLEELVVRHLDAETARPVTSTSASNQTTDGQNSGGSFGPQSEASDRRGERDGFQQGGNTAPSSLNSGGETSAVNGGDGQGGSSDTTGVVI